MLFLGRAWAPFDLRRLKAWEHSIEKRCRSCEANEKMDDGRCRRLAHGFVGLQ